MVVEFFQEALYIKSFKKSTTRIELTVTGNVNNMTVLDKQVILIPANGDGTALITFYANFSPEIYNGTLNISGDISAEVPINIEILDKERVPIQALLLSLVGTDKKLYPGSTFTFRNDLTNLLTDQEYPVRLVYTIQSLEGTETVWAYTTNVFLRTSLSLIKNFKAASSLNKIRSLAMRRNGAFRFFVSLSKSLNHRSRIYISLPSVLRSNDMPEVSHAIRTLTINLACA